MTIKKIVPHWPYILTGLWIFLLTALGVWWLYLIIHLGKEIQLLQNALPHPHHATSSAINFVEMAKWEGSTFFLLLGLVSSCLVFFYIQNLKQTQAMQAFFASLTHELKTPLASMRLQSEVIGDLVKNQSEPVSPQLTKLTQLTQRLVEDSQKLENELEKILQLSRIERGSKLTLEEFDLFELTQKILKKEIHTYSTFFNANPLQLELLKTGSFQQFYRARVDDHALRVIFRNLVENTYKYVGTQTIKVRVRFQITADQRSILLSYEDGGELFQGEVKRLGQLFYTPQARGSGIGLYLIRKLMERMNGKFIIEERESISQLTFQLFFPFVPENEKGGENS